MGTNHLAVDLGAGSGRVIRGRITDNGKIELEELYRFTTQSMPFGGNLTVNIYRIYEEVLRALQVYVRQYGCELGSMGVDTWGSDFGILDKNGKLIGIPVHYRDKRTQGIGSIVEKGIGYCRLYELTSCGRDPAGTLHQLIAMVQKRDASLECGKMLLFLGDLLHYFLTGNACSEYTVASFSQLYNIPKNDWEDEVFKIFEIPSGIQPPIVYPGERLGRIKREIADFVGLSQTEVIAPAVHDSSCAVLAVPTKSEGDWAFISSGTWSVVGMELDKPIINRNSYVGDISNSGMAFGRILFKKNVMGLWIIQQCMKVWDGVGVSLNYEQIVEAAAQARPFVGFIEPDKDSFFNPIDMVGAILQYLEQSGQIQIEPQDVGQISRIVFESLAMKYHYTVNLLREASGRQIDRIHIIGGGSSNELLNEFTASATCLTVFAGPTEATAIGNVMLQAYGCGELGSQDAIREKVRESFPTKCYRPKATSEWRVQYRRFLEICGLGFMSR
jgi:rhamnulokinase